MTRVTPGDVVILGKLGAPKGRALRTVIHAADAKLFFSPPYSSDLNPIERVFAKPKHALRNAAARTADTTSNVSQPRSKLSTQPNGETTSEARDTLQHESIMF